MVDSRSPRSLWPVVAAMAMTAALLSPLAVLGVHGLTLTGMTEESTGYRYFYTLRMLYGDRERPWLPQGQLPGLAHMAIQLALTGLGYPPDSLFPRIDRFAYAAAALPHLCALAAFAWMARRLPARTAFAAAAFAALGFSSGRGGSAYTLTAPDYMSWAEPVALMTAGWLLRLYDAGDVGGWKSDIRIGIFGGLCLSIKPTYAVFVLPIVIATLLTTKPVWRAIAATVSAGIVALATWITVIWIYNLGDLQAATMHFAQLRTFVANIPAGISLTAWLKMAGFDTGVTVTTVAIALPAVLGLTLAFLPRKSLSAALLVGSLASLVIGYRRPEDQTFIEMNAYFVAAALAWAFGILPLVSPSFRIFSPERSSRTATVVLTAALWLVVVQHVYVAADALLPRFETADSGARRLSSCLAATPGRTLFLIPDNSYRPTTVDSAIFKGGSDISRYYWGASPYVQRMFPDRGYAVGATTARLAPSELAGYSKVVFVSLPEKRDDAVQRLQTLFGVSIDQFDCSCTIDFQYHIVNACHR